MKPRAFEVSTRQSRFRRKTKAIGVSAAKMGDEPQDERKAKADDDRGGDGEVKGGVFAAMDDVARQSAQPERETPAEVKYRAGAGHDQA
jgi:hypothetical protein